MTAKVTTQKIMKLEKSIQSASDRSAQLRPTTKAVISTRRMAFRAFMMGTR
jgi:hypothetical protein